MAIDLGDDDGFVDVTLAGQTAHLDLWETNHKLVALHERNKAKPNGEYNQALVELVVELGLPRCSHRAALKFMAAIGDAVSDEKKSTGGTAPSPASTGSTPADSHAA